MQTKSKIRNRWYRANERPLESNSSTSLSNTAPIGEVELSSFKFKDDLDDEMARQASRNSDKRPRSVFEKTSSKEASDRSSSKRAKGNTRARSKRIKSTDQNSDQAGSPDSANRSRGKVRREKTKPRERDLKRKPSSVRKKKPDAAPKSAVSKFLSKIFGA